MEERRQQSEVLNTFLKRGNTAGSRNMAQMLCDLKAADVRKEELAQKQKELLARRQHGRLPRPSEAAAAAAPPPPRPSETPPQSSAAADDDDDSESSDELCVASPVQEKRERATWRKVVGASENTAGSDWTTGRSGPRGIGSGAVEAAGADEPCWRCVGALCWRCV